MKKLDEFIEKLESNKTTPNERREFVNSLTKNEFVYFLKQDIDIKKILDIRSDLFEENIYQTEKLIKKFTISELKNILHQIKPEYVTIKNLFIEHLIRKIHNTTIELDVNKIINFKHRVETNKMTHEDIRTFLLKMKKEEFSVLITIDKQETDNELESISESDKIIDEMYEYQAEIIAEILEEYTEEEMVKLIPFLNKASTRIRAMFFKCFNENKANEVFLKNPKKYSKDIFSYIVTPTQNKEKDEMIVSILSNPKLYSLYENHELQYLRTLISNKEIIIDETSNIINTTEEEITQEAAKYIANLKCRIKNSISRGIQKKMSSQKLYELLNEVNKGLQNIQEEELTHEEFIKLTEMPLDKTILFLKNCINLTEDQKKQILENLYKNIPYNDINNNELYMKIMTKYTKIVSTNNKETKEYFDYIYPDILEMSYNKSFFDSMLINYARNNFNEISEKYMNIFLSQLIEKINTELKLNIKKEFYLGKAIIFDTNQIRIIKYNEIENKISININYNDEKRTNKLPKQKAINMVKVIENIFYEFRIIYQKTKPKDIGNIKDLYFLLDNLIQNELNQDKKNIVDNNTYNKIDAKLYSIASTLSLLNVNPELKNKYWNLVKQETLELSKKRKNSKLKENKSLTEIYNEILGGIKTKELIYEYPMLEIITDEGFILNDSELKERYKAVKSSLKEEKNEETYKRGEKILNFLEEYLYKIYNQ